VFIYFYSHNNSLIKALFASFFSCLYACCVCVCVFFQILLASFLKFCVSLCKLCLHVFLQVLFVRAFVSSMHLLIVSPKERV
jgi:hypothetical protein